MTDREFLERMTFLAQKLFDVTDTDGYGSDAYKSVLDEVHELGTSFNPKRPVSRGVMTFVYIAAILFVLYLISLLFSDWFGL